MIKFIFKCDDSQLNSVLADIEWPELKTIKIRDLIILVDLMMERTVILTQAYSLILLRKNF